jgi:hypothetical protein
MNIITINKISYLQKIISIPLFISGNGFQLEEEIDYNFWCISFTSNSIQKITIAQLTQFFKDLIENKSKQLKRNNIAFPALFYVWFDKQALQLRFNCISNINNKLPFGCTLMLLDSPIDIFKDCLTTTRDFFKNGDTIEFFNSPQEAEDAKEEKFVLSVFVERIDYDK